jgi:hypothetical protein
MVLLCDGRLVCGCADPYGKRVLGDVRTSSVSQVWTGETASSLRKDIVAGGSKFCGDCPLKLPLRKDEPPPQRPLDVGALPSRLYIECTAACNISCAQACCAPETGITRTRQAGMLDFELFKRVVDEAGPSLGRIDFFNYGEAFLHKRAIEMCEYVKSRFPHIYLYTSTNGLAFTEDSVRRLVHSGIDEVTFSIDGATPESYVTYRQRGDFGKAIRHLRAATDEKQRAGRDVPFINWRYILFSHNDSDAEMQLARTMAADMGVDRLCWELTDHPENMFSRRFVKGSAELEALRHEIWDDNNLGNAIPGATGGDPCPWTHPGSARRGSPGTADFTDDEDSQPVDQTVSGSGQLRSQARSSRRAIVSARRRGREPRLRARVASYYAATGRHDAGADDDHRTRQTGTLRAEVRSGQRGDRLVRGVRVADDDADAGGDLRRGRGSGLSARHVGAGLNVRPYMPDCASSSSSSNR